MKSSLSFGAACSLVGLAIGIYISLSAIGSGWEWFFVYSTAAAFLTSTILWHLLVVKKQKPRPALAGTLSGLLSHWLTFYLMILEANICHHFTGGCVSTLGEPPMDMLVAIPGSLAFSFFSLLFFGWITATAGGLIGYLFARRFRP